MMDDLLEKYHSTDTRGRPWRWRVTPDAWRLITAEIKRDAYMVELDPTTKKLPNKILGWPVLIDRAARDPWALEIDPMDPDEMPAGSDLDHAIIEKVMQWEWQADEYFPNDGYWCGDRAPSLADQREPTRHFSPSTNIAHAWEVVEKLRALGRPMSIHGGVSPSDAPAVRWIVQTLDAKAYGETAALALCRAALKAVR